MSTSEGKKEYFGPTIVINILRRVLMEPGWLIGPPQEAITVISTWNVLFKLTSRSHANQKSRKIVQFINKHMFGMLGAKDAEIPDSA